ncbi:hypothetical protein ACW2QC_01110 [Virgibacillus sp. FSP13]
MSLLYLLYLLFKHFVWNVYIVNPTAWDTLEDKDGQTVIKRFIDKQKGYAVLHTNNSFHMYAF